MKSCEESITRSSDHRAEFFIIANQRPSVQLQKYIDGDAFPADVIFIYPQLSNTFHTALPPAWESLSDAIAWCIAEAEKLNFSLLSPSSLIWKLAGLVQLAATGSTAGSPHAFQVEDIPSLFEQAIVQLQDFPAPPDFYRPQKHEPPLTSNQHVRIICGLPGAGKTSWAAEAVLHCPEMCVYYDVGDLPGPSLASTLVRELAARFGALTPSRLVNGKAGISPVMELKLSKVLGRSPESWLAMQRNFDLWGAKLKTDLSDCVSIKF